MEFEDISSMAPALALSGTFLEFSSNESEEISSTVQEEKVTDGYAAGGASAVGGEKMQKHKIKVDQSRPPTREERQRVMDSRKSADPAANKRGKSKSTMLSFVPRNVMRNQTAAARPATKAAGSNEATAGSNGSTDGNAAQGKPLSNNDFRAMIMKK